jgi:hypothetical protein
MSSDEEEMKFSRREVNSDMNVVLEEDGGRYMLSRVKGVVVIEAERTLVGGRAVNETH